MADVLQLVSNKLAGKVVLVTGAGRGLGWGIARTLARAAANVAVTDINLDDIKRTVKAIRDDQAATGEGWGCVLDTGDQDSIEAGVQGAVERFGRLDAVIHCAVYMPLLRFTDTTPQSFWQQLEVGLGGLFHLTKLALPHLADGGHVVNIASGSSVRGYHDESTYCALKHAQEGWMKAVALEWQHDGIPVGINSMGPGKPIKPTRMTWQELEALPEAEKAAWVDPMMLGAGFVWLLSQPPARFRGLRFDAGVISDTLAQEGFDFEVTPEKVSMYPADFRERLEWMASYQIP
jgi:NAD(P)-dependent dehydrogenase (short-subunit alcohol dehydrogenase family)